MACETKYSNFLNPYFHYKIKLAKVWADWVAWGLVWVRCSWCKLGVVFPNRPGRLVGPMTKNDTGRKDQRNSFPWKSVRRWIPVTHKIMRAEALYFYYMILIPFLFRIQIRVVHFCCLFKAIIKIVFDSCVYFAFMSAPTHTARVLRLYRNILRSHKQKLPSYARPLADKYVQSEFRAHKSAHQKYVSYKDELSDSS